MDTVTGALRHVLVATDLSEPAAAAVIRAAHLATEHGARLTALHVEPTGMRTDFSEPARGAVAALVDGLLDPSASADAAPTITVRRGRAAVEITAEAADTAADLVVIGASGEHGLVEALLGSTAENVVRMSPVPVLVVKRPGTDSYRSVVLALDATTESAEAARFGLGLTPAADHVVVHVSTVVGESLMHAFGVSGDDVEGLRRAALDRARRDISRLTGTLNPCPREIAVVGGHPPTALEGAARSVDADLIVVGTGARSRLSYAFLGSVAQHVMREAQCDVLVVPTLGA
ncbi:hypothetical protein AU195_17545 [Mycobacterium sp. IS-1496]|uniref:universal stress protein n=1 Tax=Mycobacterium sp. IS-1496 TaxID=1772284 RepID=UPI0007417C73|nr:universal stress protein [Mycobacterium sp. IS-1496]KUI23076.1 hypothetical protein AU195_17545 [Mycobacterium sp. IS-1496]